MDAKTGVKVWACLCGAFTGGVCAPPPPSHTALCFLRGAIVTGNVDAEGGSLGLLQREETCIDGEKGGVTKTCQLGTSYREMLNQWEGGRESGGRARMSGCVIWEEGAWLGVSWAVMVYRS